MSRLAAASTIPVTNAARQENNGKSFRILMACDCGGVVPEKGEHRPFPLPSCSEWVSYMLAQSTGERYRNQYYRRSKGAACPITAAACAEDVDQRGVQSHAR